MEVRGQTPTYPNPDEPVWPDATSSEKQEEKDVSFM